MVDSYLLIPNYHPLLIPNYHRCGFMKIFYCIDSLEKSGGTERVTTTKVNWFAEQADIEVYVVTINDKTPYFQLSDKVNRIVLNVEPLSSKKYTAEISKYIDKIKPDVCIAVSGIATNVLYKLNDHSKKIIEFHYTKNFLVNFVKGIRKIRFKNLHVLKMRWLQWRLQKQAKKYDCMVGLTKRDVGLWGNPKNMTYIYNPLSFRSSIKSTCDNKKIIAVGSWTPAKGMDQLIEAFALIAPKHTDWAVEIYGSGQDEALLRELIAQNNLEDQVFLFEPCKNIGQKLVEASIYAFPSRSDGFGLVITEAMECGLPTVAMDCECGPREIVTSETGIVVADKDTREFANALEKLIDDEDLRKSMGKRASAEVKRFYPDNIMPNWVNLFTPPDNNLINSALPLWHLDLLESSPNGQ